MPSSDRCHAFFITITNYTSHAAVTLRTLRCDFTFVVDVMQKLTTNSSSKPDFNSPGEFSLILSVFRTADSYSQWPSPCPPIWLENRMRMTDCLRPSCASRLKGLFQRWTSHVLTTCPCWDISDRNISIHGGVCMVPSTVWLVGVDADHGVTAAWPLYAGQLEQVVVFTLWGNDGTDCQQRVQVLCAAGSCKYKTQHYTSWNVPEKSMWRILCLSVNWRKWASCQNSIRSCYENELNGH